MSRFGRKISFIRALKVAGALHSPKGITKLSNRPYLVLKALSHSRPSCIRIRLKAPIMSSLVQYFALLSWDNVSCIRGSGVGICHISNNNQHSLQIWTTFLHAAFFFFASDFNCICSYLAVTQYQRKVQNVWFNVKEDHSCLRFHLQVPLRSYGRFFFTPSQPSSVNTNPGERLKNPELSRFTSIIFQLFSSQYVIWGVSFSSGVGAQATQTIPENTTRRWTTTPSIVCLCL